MIIDRRHVSKIIFGAVVLSPAALMGNKITDGNLLPPPIFDSDFDTKRKKLLNKIFFGNLLSRNRKISAFIGADQSSLIRRNEKYNGLLLATNVIKKVEPADDEAAIHSLNAICELDSTRLTDIPPQNMSRIGSFVSAGSPFTNFWCRFMMYDCVDKSNPFLIYLNGRSYALGYNFAYNKHINHIKYGRYERKLSGETILSRDRFIISSSKNIFKGSITQSGLQNTYLLFSKLPHPWYLDRSVALWAGCTGPATEATNLVISSISMDKLRWLDEKLVDARYFQILFEVHNIEFSIENDRHMARTINIAKNGSEDAIHIISEHYLQK